MQTDAATRSSPLPIGRRVLLLVFTGLVAMTIDLCLPAFPAIAHDLGASPAEVQQTLSAYLAGLAIGQLFSGPLADRIGRRPVLLAGLVVHTLASFGCALVDTAGQLLWLRLLQALGGCVAPVVVRAYVRDVASGQQAARLLSLLMASMLIIPLLAPAIGGQIVVHAGWRATFVLLGVIGTVAVLSAWRSFPETSRRAGGTQQWSRLLHGYGELLRDAVTWRYVGGGAAISGAMFAYLAASPFVFIGSFGVPVEHFFLVFSANILAVAAGGFLNARIVTRHGPVRMFERALMLQSIAALVLCVTAWLAPHSLLAYALPLSVFLAGLQAVNSNAAARAVEHYPHAAGTASAFAGMMQFLSGAATAAAVGHLGLPPPQALAAVIALCTAVAVGFAVACPRDRTA